MIRGAFDNSSLRSYIIFHRHGHRAPVKNIFGKDEESNLWLNLLPKFDILSALNEQYPVTSHPRNPKPRDLSSHPYGCITKKGFEHLLKTGEILHDKFPSLQNMSSIEVVATNYQRTQVRNPKSIIHKVMESIL